MAVPKPLEANLPEVDSESIGVLDSTVGSFAHRLSLQLKQKEVADELANNETRVRHDRILQAMTIIRKALAETCKIKLGARFQFDLDISDWEGWPRLELNLIDLCAPELLRYGMIVSANDRNSNGTVNLTLRSGEVIGRIFLNEADGSNKVAVVLKRAVLRFLDETASYVLNPPRPEELAELVAKPIEAETGFDVISDKLRSEDVFIPESMIPDHNRVIDDEGDNPLESGAFMAK